MIARTHNFTLSFIEMKVLDALTLVIVFFDGRKILNSYIVHGSQVNKLIILIVDLDRIIVEIVSIFLSY